MTVPSGPVVTSTTTASGSSTRFLATYSTRSLAAIGVLLMTRSLCAVAGVAEQLPKLLVAQRRVAPQAKRMLRSASEAEASLRYLAAGLALRSTLGMMPAFCSSLETVSDGEAPWASHFFTFSALTTNSTGSILGL